jgi:uncharacterized membrane protein
MTARSADERSFLREVFSRCSYSPQPMRTTYMALVRMGTGRRGTSSSVENTDHSGSFVFAPALTIGVGLGGFVDGVLLHQILGWHHMLSARPAYGMRTNELADGLFHAGAWLVVLGGVLWLYARLRLPPVPAAWPRLATGPRPWRALVGPMLIGWGLFNVVEGLVDHQVLVLHHVRPGAHQLAWDLGFLAFGAALAGVGLLLARPGRPRRGERAETSSR